MLSKRVYGEESVTYGVAMGAVSTVLRVFASVAFVILVTRRLSIDEFGVWGLIIAIAETFTAIPELWNFWLSRAPKTRGIPRRTAAWTAMMLASLYGLAAASVYIAWVYMASLTSSLATYTLPLLTGAGIIVVGSFWNYMIKAGEVETPARLSKGFMIYETTRLIFVLLFVTFGNLRLLGAVLAVLLGRLAATLYMARVLGVGRSTETDIREAIRESIRGSIVPILNMTSLVSYRIQRVIVYAATASKEAVVYLNLVMGIVRPLLFFSRIGVSPVYSKTIQDEQGANITYRLAVPFTLLVLAVTLASPRGLASMFNPLYVNVWMIIPLGSIAGIADTLLMIEYYTAMGKSRPDKHGIQLREVLYSGLRYVSQYRAAARLSVLLAVVITAITVTRDPLILSIAFIASFIAAEIVAYLIIRLHNLREGHAEPIPLRELAASVSALLISQIPAYLLGSNNIIVYSITREGPYLIAHLTLISLVYMAVMLILSPWYRYLLRRVYERLFHEK